MCSRLKYAEHENKIIDLYNESEDFDEDHVDAYIEGFETSKKMVEFKIVTSWAIAYVIADLYRVSPQPISKEKAPTVDELPLLWTSNRKDFVANEGWVLVF